MGGQPTKLANPRANVINNVEVIDHTPHLDSLYILILILVVLTALNLLLKVYIMHKRSMRKTYLSRGNDLDKV